MLPVTPRRTCLSSSWAMAPVSSRVCQLFLFGLVTEMHLFLGHFLNGRPRRFWIFLVITQKGLVVDFDFLEILPFPVFHDRDVFAVLVDHLLLGVVDLPGPSGHYADGLIDVAGMINQAFQ